MPREGILKRWHYLVIVATAWLCLVAVSNAQQYLDHEDQNSLVRDVKAKEEAARARNSESLKQRMERIYQRQNQDDLKKVGKLPETLASPYLRGVMAMKSGEWDQAILEFSAAITVNTADVDAYVRRAEARGRKGEREAAITDLNLAIVNSTDQKLRERLKKTISELETGEQTLPRATRRR
jgi:tetratricopeptide (TPR) repeat protein